MKDREINPGELNTPKMFDWIIKLDFNKKFFKKKRNVYTIC